MRHAPTREAASVYRVEPYVVAADIGGHPPHVGRGGWSWYTGSAAWLYRFAVEGLLGVRRRANALTIAPRLPNSWPGYQFSYRFNSSRYEVEVILSDEDAEAGVVVDGIAVAGVAIPLVDDGGTHDVRVTLARKDARVAGAAR